MADPEQTWQTIRAPTGGVGPVAMAFAAFYKDLQKYEVRHPFFGPAFLRATDLVIRAAFAGHEALAKALCKELVPFAHAVADAPGGAELDILDTPNLAALTLFSLADAMRWTELAVDLTGPETSTVLGRLLQMSDFSDEARDGVILAMLRFNQIEKSKEIADLAPIRPFLAALLSGDAAPLWPAWRDAFPAEARANKVTWHQLLFVVQLLAPKGQPPVSWLTNQIG
ncbi:MAG: hypothetical protein MUE52_07125 [Tabrizicola sp.]|jgi:hypothetical protein|nr:hypothetical protein [Tabrizicola sp.]